MLIDNLAYHQVPARGRGGRRGPSRLGGPSRRAERGRVLRPRTGWRVLEHLLGLGVNPTIVSPAAK
jgi:hypothetical protein